MTEFIIIGLDGEKFDPNHINGYKLAQLKAFHSNMLTKYISDIHAVPLDDGSAIVSQHDNLNPMHLITERIRVLELNEKVLNQLSDAIIGRYKFRNYRGVDAWLKEMILLLENTIDELLPETKEKIIAFVKLFVEDPLNIFKVNKQKLLTLLGNPDEL